MKYCLLGWLLFLSFYRSDAQSIYGLDPNSNKDNIGIFSSLSFSSSASMIHNSFGYSNTAKGANSTVPVIGIYYQKGIGNRLSVRIGFSLGHMSNAYKYASEYDSIGLDYQPRTKVGFDKYEKTKNPTSFVQPQVEIGYLFGPIKDMYLIEVRAGVGLQTYLGHNSDSVNITGGTVTERKMAYTYKYYFAQSAVYGNPGVFGSVVSNIYVGLRWQKTDNEFLNRFSLGIQGTLPISNSNAGYSLMEYKDENFNVVGQQKIYLSQFSFGIRAAFNLL
jgi:hypothetical protein